MRAGRRGTIAGLISMLTLACGVDGGRTHDETDVLQALEGYFAAFRAKDATQLKLFTTPDFVLYEGGYPIERDRWLQTWDSLEPVSAQHRFREMEITVFGDVARLSYVLEWLDDGEVSTMGRETAVAVNADDQWRFSHFHSSWFPPVLSLDTGTLEEYVGIYRSDSDGVSFRLRVGRDRDRLYLERDDGGVLEADLTRLQLFPEGEDRLYLEVNSNRVIMHRDQQGNVVSMVYHPFLQWNATYRWTRIPSRSESR